MEENRDAQNQPRTYGDESRMYENQSQNGQQQWNGGTQNYGQQQWNGGNQNYGQQQWNGYAPQPQHGSVNDACCYVLLAVWILRILVMFLSSQKVYSVLTPENMLDGSYFDVIFNSTSVGLSLFSNLLNMLFLVCVIVDIVMIYRQNYKITGLILFAIFLRPGYYIWRAHILGRKKTFPIIYTVAYVLLLIAYWLYMFYQAFLLVMPML